MKSKYCMYSVELDNIFSINKMDKKTFALNQQG